MKKLMLVMLFAAAALPAMGAMTARLYNESPGPGGPYRAVLSGDAAGMFQTFCLEGGNGGVTEYFTPGNLYYISIDDVVKFGGGPEELLREETKMLYAAFLNGGAVTQEMIWNSENYNSYAGYDFAANGLNVDGYGSVKVMNLWSTEAGIGNPQYAAQSHLIMVPVPGALMLGSLGMGVVGWLRRRRVM